LPRHFLTGAELSADELRALLDRALELKTQPRASTALADRHVALVFEKPSTRTRVTFEVGIRELGGDAVVLRADELQLARGESPRDTALVLSRHVHAIGVRTGPHEIVEELERDPESSDPEHQLSLAMRFDALLRAAAGNQVITSLINTASIFGWALRLRAVQAMHDTPEVGLSRIREHREIVTALRARDADRVETLMRRHLTTGIDYVLKHAR